MSPAEQFGVQQEQLLWRQQQAAAIALAAAEQQRQEQERQRQEQQARDAVKARMVAEGALCDLEFGAPATLCMVAAAGRCGRCNRAFCDSHRGDNVSTTCRRCGDDDARRQAEVARREQEWQEQTQRQRQADVLAKRAEAAERKAVHAETVATREKALGWSPQARRRIATLDVRLARRHGDDVAVLTTIFAAGVLVAAVVLMVRANTAGGHGWEQVCLLAAVFWSGWKLLMKFEQYLRGRWWRERTEIAKTRGCGVQGCPYCARVPG
jgi:hypothetical protein